MWNKTNRRTYLESEQITANMENVQRICTDNGFELFDVWVRDWPGRLVKRNRANVKFLNLINGTDSQSAVVGQSQTVIQKKTKKQEATSVTGNRRNTPTSWKSNRCVCMHFWNQKRTVGSVGAQGSKQIVRACGYELVRAQREEIDKTVEAEEAGREKKKCRESSAADLSG